MLKGSLPSSYIGLSSISFLNLCLFIYSSSSNVRKVFLFRALGFVSLLYMFVIFSPSARDTFKLIIPIAFIIIALVVPQDLDLRVFYSFLCDLFSRFTVKISRFSRSILYLFSLSLCSSLIVLSISFLFFSPIPSRGFSVLTRMLVFNHMAEQSISSPASFLLGHGAGSTTLRFDVSSNSSRPLSQENIDMLTSVSSHSMPLEAVYEYGWPYTIFLSFLFINSIKNSSLFLSRTLIFLSSFLSTNILLPSISISAEPLHQLFLPALCFLIILRNFK